MPLIVSLLAGPPDPARPVVASDMEGTLSAGVTWRGMRDYLLAHGRKDDFNRFYRPRIWKLPLYYLGLIDRQRFREGWIRGIFRLFAGSSRAEFDDVADWVVKHELWPQRREKVIAELQRLQASGHRVVIISGLIEPMLGRFASRVGVEAIGTPLKFKGEQFSGEIEGQFTTGKEKVAQLGHFAGVDGKIEAAYGDTFADVPMLTMSRLPTAVAPEPKLRRIAHANGWRIIEAA